MTDAVKTYTVQIKVKDKQHTVVKYAPLRIRVKRRRPWWPFPHWVF